VSLRAKLYTVSILLHSLLLVVGIIFREELGLWLIAIELILVISLFIFLWLIRKGLQPLEYIDIFSNLLKEQEFTSRFSSLNQPDLDRLIEQFNIMLDRLHQERLRAGERQHVFEKLMVESPIGVVLLDYDNSISECNASAKKLLESAILNRVSDNAKALPFTYNRLCNAFELDKITINQQHLITTSEGQRLKIGHYRFRDRGFERSFFLIQEITSDILKSQKEAYEKLIRLMSHEVNNTIAITNSLLESCLNYKSELTTASQDDFAKAIKVVIDRSASLNQFMQGYSEVVKLPRPAKSKFNLTQLVENMAILFYSECNNQQIEIQTTIEKTISVTADPHLIEQVLLNIIKNAIEAIEANPVIQNLVIQQPDVIQIILKQTADDIQLEIKDNGCGISDEIKHQLFTPFFTTKESGQGVGLMLIDDILTAHEFPYKLANNIEGSGAYFRIRFD
jgi:two-component system nitrogen regulation sensor histidine kinase NtrY